MLDFIWSASRTETLEECDLRHYFEYLSDIPKKNLLTYAPFVSGNVIHSFLENFYGPDGKPRVKYTCPSSLGGAIKGLWFYSVSDGSYRNKKIEWTHKEDVFKFADVLDRAGRKIFDRLVQEEAPILSEFRFGDKKNPLKVRHNDHYHMFSGAIDQIRRGPVIRDFKLSGSPPSDVTLNHSVALTIYALAFCTLAHFDKRFREKVEVSDEDASGWGGNPTFIDEKVRIEIYSLGSNEIHTTSRSDRHFLSLMEKIDGLEEKVREDITNRHFEAKVAIHCGMCSAKKYCDSYLSSVEPKILPMQLELNYLETNADLQLNDPKIKNQTKRFRFPKE